MQGGHIGVSSVPGAGARFWFQLPMRSVATKDVQVNADWIKQIKERALRILLVDDNAVNLLVARMMLKKCLPSCVITEASGGRAALESLEQNRFDIVLMDMVMPEIDGMQVTKVLRNSAEEYKRKLPVLALTASANPIDHDRCLQAGMDDVIQKPLDEQQLISKISSAYLMRLNKESV
jgi:CheY-like chemotaxis protein